MAECQSQSSEILTKMIRASTQKALETMYSVLQQFLKFRKCKFLVQGLHYKVLKKLYLKVLSKVNEEACSYIYMNNLAALFNRIASFKF